MTRKADLIALRDAVQAGEWFPGMAQRSLGGVQTYHYARNAFYGSVDAALAFLAATLQSDDPQYGYLIGPKYARIVHRSCGTVCDATAETPARALLIATLNALIGEAE